MPIRRNLAAQTDRRLLRRWGLGGRALDLIVSVSSMPPPKAARLSSWSGRRSTNTFGSGSTGWKPSKERSVGSLATSPGSSLSGRCMWLFLRSSQQRRRANGSSSSRRRAGEKGLFWRPCGTLTKHRYPVASRNEIKLTRSREPLVVESACKAANRADGSPVRVLISNISYEGCHLWSESGTEQGDR